MNDIERFYTEKINDLREQVTRLTAEIERLQCECDERAIDPQCGNCKHRGKDLICYEPSSRHHDLCVHWQMHCEHWEHWENE